MKKTVTKTMTEINEHMVLTINLKVEEKTKVISENMERLQTENKT